MKVDFELKTKCVPLHVYFYVTYEEIILLELLLSYVLLA
jgi:hypothetical protein